MSLQITGVFIITPKASFYASSYVQRNSRNALCKRSSLLSKLYQMRITLPMRLSSGFCSTVVYVGICKLTYGKAGYPATND